MFSYEQQPTNIDGNLSGLKMAKVIRNSFPVPDERLGVRVLGVHDINRDDSDYYCIARHCAPSPSSSGDLPEEGKYVYGMFLDNNPFEFVWMGIVRFSNG